MADYETNRVTRTQADVTGATDAGLRAHMLKVYNLMFLALLVTGGTAYLTYQAALAPDIASAARVLSNGMALSSRNRYLSPIQRQDALVLSQALFNAKKMVDAGTRSTDRVIAETTHLLGERRRIRLIYAQIVDRCTMETMKEIIPGKSLLAIAAWVDEVRLIDNIVL